MNDNSKFPSIKEIILSSPNGKLEDILNLSSMELIDKYVRPFYKRLEATNLKLALT